MEISKLFPHSQNNVNLGNALHEVGTNGEVLVSESTQDATVAVIITGDVTGDKTGADKSTFKRISVTRGWVGRVVHTLKYYFGVKYRAKVKYSRRTVLEEILKACATLESHIKNQPEENSGESNDLVNLEDIHKEILEITRDDRNYSRGSFYRERVGAFMGTIGEISGRAGEYLETGPRIAKLSKSIEFLDQSGSGFNVATGERLAPDARPNPKKSFGSSATQDSRQSGPNAGSSTTVAEN